MNNGHNLLFKISLILLVIGIIILTILKFVYKPVSVENIEITNSVGDVVYYNHDINYKEDYKENIIYDIIYEIPYSIVDDSGVLQGRLLIGSDKKLYITNDIIQKRYLVLDKEIKTLYNPLTESEVFSFYTLTSEGNVYHISLSNTDINMSTIGITKYELPSAVTNFTSLSFHSFIGDITSNIVVFCEDGNMYDISTGILYSNDIFKITNQYIIYGDNRVTNYSGNILVNSNKEDYRIKAVVAAKNKILELNSSPKTLLITTDNRLIYLINSDTVYEHYKKVKAIFPEGEYINILFDDDSILKFLGYYNKAFYSIVYNDD